MPIMVSIQCGPGRCQITGLPIHKELVAALVVIKKAALLTNISIGALAPGQRRSHHRRL